MRNHSTNQVWLTPRTVQCYTLMACLCLTAACAAPEPADDVPPEMNRFTKDVLVEGMEEPMQLEFDAHGRVYWILRGGGIQRLDPATGTVEDLGKIPTAAVEETGLLGLLLARDFEQSGHLYVYYAHLEGEHEMRLSRLTLGGNGRIDLDSEIIMMRWPFDEGSHMGGGMTWDADGNLYLTTGDNANATQYTPIHWTNAGGRAQDAQRTSANPNDLRGKILRIHPEADGTYTIPEGNLFVDDDPLTRPEIFTMGNRNPWRLSIDSKTGYLHWGEIGPDAGADSANVGPRGYDELNVARQAGNFGWPYFIGYNRAYNQYDRDAQNYGEPFDPFQPVNTSPNNTGPEVLPPAQPPLIAYPYAVSDQYPILGSGGRNAVGGPIFYRDDFRARGERVFPAWYEGGWFVTDFVRNWIMVIRMNEERTEVTAIERFMPEIGYNSPLDMDFSPTGDLYVLEYGTQWGTFNPDARISRIVYNDGNRAPVAAASASRQAGAVPMEIQLSSAGTLDFDRDHLTYSWLVSPRDGSTSVQYDEANPGITLTRAGTYDVTLTATDVEGATGSDALVITAGNAPPVVALDLIDANESFYFPDAAISFQTRVEDAEDGQLGQDIALAEVAVTWEYVPSGLTPAEEARVGDLAATASARHLSAVRIMEGSDCYVCHMVAAASAGPAYRDVAERYQGDVEAGARLAQKIIRGGSGVWGETPMPAHPALSQAEARALAEYVLSLSNTEEAPERVQPSGKLVTTVPSAAQGKGAFVLRASYTDSGAEGVAPITSSDALVLRAPFLEPRYADVTAGTRFTDSRDPGFFIEADGGYVGFNDIDLTGIDSIDVHVMTRFYTWSHFVGGTLEIRLDSLDGERVGAPVLQSKPTSTGHGGSGTGGDNAPGRPVFFGTDPVGFDVSHLSGRRSLYVVFRNAQANGAPLFLLNGVAFKRDKSLE